MAESESSAGLGRRTFVTGVVGLLGGIIAAVVGLPAVAYWLGPSLKKQESDAWVPLGPVENIPVDVPTLFSFTRTKQLGWERSATSYGVYVLRSADGQVQALSNVCTHLSCRVTWNAERNIYLCPCHDGLFARDGAIVSGPQPRPLDPFAFRIEDGTLLVHVVEA
jgi:menaquinol-cytochrome c reductase iron-sulfur subunit